MGHAYEKQCYQLKNADAYRDKQQVIEELLALWPVLGAVAWQSPALPSITDKAFVEDCVCVHNDLRTKVHPAASNMRYMTWDAALARTARAWANKCIFEHNVYLLQKCTKVCGHYIQVVWDDSYKIGCAVTLCKEVAGIRNAANFICNYSPGKPGPLLGRSVSLN
ncbi:PREDICTED: glioma pathogenesis-related protein 1-like [Charadrius vociferus]|uniref:glioma pathogenesis-related protein 1-like n=1 Tax=Charadrius vociferus TaxID=50402 RepID=UPI0005213724|nr:PREDICTED: glioma pathogenesis-related protein 1-like [Charadrius vociferus]